MQHPNTNQNLEDCMRVMSINCRGIKSKRKQRELQSAIEQEDPDIICGSETWIDNTYFNSELFPNSYDIFRKDRNRYGGGVFIGVKRDLLAMQEDSMDVDCEAIWIKIIFAGKQPLFVGSFYRPKNNDPTPLVKLDEAVKKLTSKTTLPNIVLAGDFNTPDIDWENNTIVSGKNKPQYGMRLNQTLMDLANDNMLSQMQHSPSRGDNILDLIFTTIPDQIRKVETVPGMSDHDAVAVELDTTVKYACKKPRKVFLYKKGNMDGLRDDMEKYKDSFLNSNPMSKDVETNWTEFKSEVFHQMEKHIPQKQVSSWQDVPWMKKSIKRQIRKKKRLWKKAKRNSTEKNWQDFKDMRKKVKSSMKKAYEEYVEGILDNSLTESHKNFWKFINSQKKESAGIPTLKTEEGLATISATKAEALNRQYQSVFTEEDTSSFPEKGPSPYSVMPPISFTTEGIEKLLRNLNPQKASGPDLIPIRILREAAHQIAPILQVIFTQSYNTGTLPADWLSANIVAIFKKGNRSIPANYRPVSLTCVTTKIMEHIVFHSIMEHIDINNILASYQHGFRQKHSTESQLISTLEEIAKSMDNNIQTDILILDFSKAFDTVAHQRLLKKLTFYGIDNATTQWIRTWLTTRNQRVVVDGEASTTVHVDSGVPQGTVLGPLMFLLFINDIGDNITSTIKLFADDCLLFRTIKSDEDTSKLQEDLNNLNEWSNLWQMQFNAKKCYTLRVHRGRSPITHNYIMGREELTTVTNQAYLGVELHERLSWKQHIESVASKAGRTLGFLRRNLGKCSPSLKKQAYIALVRSQLEYASVTWDPHRQNQINQLERIQRRAIRFICGNYKRDASVSAMQQDLGLPTLEERRKRARLVMLYKVINNLIAIPLPDYITPRTRSTRSSQQHRFTRLSSSSDTYKYSFFPRTLRDWDELPQATIELPNLEQFKGAIGAN